MRKRLIAMVLVSLMLLPLFASGIAAAAPAPLKVAYIINGALGDQSFYDSGQSGIDRIKKEFGAKTTTIECNFDTAKYPQALQSAVQWNADVIFVISYGYEDLLQQYADNYPTKKWVNIDTVVTNSKKTITSVDFVEEEGAFMAGVAAALATTDTSIPGINADKIIGAVGGEDDPVIRAFIYGYEQGAHYIDKSIVVKSVFAGTWDDPVRGKQAAKQLYSQKADVVFQIAALTGSGVLEAAKEEGKYAIGVDSNQNGLQPGHVITSDLKDVGQAIYDVYSSILDGKYKPGEVLEYGLKTGGVGLAIDEYTKGILPAKTIQRILDIEQKVKAGQILVKKYQ
ncbi:MAG: BMP family ABC transporter substrate-binding protein [Clostridia bacterium]|nr:BMP family ABC transporter substrate-binding protein [Clostridia bacterium]